MGSLLINRDHLLLNKNKQHLPLRANVYHMIIRGINLVVADSF